MSRAYKDKLVDEIIDAGGTVNFPEKLSGADLAQMLLTIQNGISATDSGTGGKKVLGNNTKFAGSPNVSALTGGDMERFAGSQ